MSRAHARMRSRLGRAGVLDDRSINKSSEWFALLAALGSRRRARKALRVRLRARIRRARAWIAFAQQMRRPWFHHARELVAAIPSDPNTAATAPPATD